MTARPLRQLAAIESCLGCPWVRERILPHPLNPRERLIQFRCGKAKREITPHDGIAPPPMWCPLPVLAKDAAPASGSLENDP